MKKTLAVLLVSLLLFSLSSCEGKTSYDKGYADGYEEGYVVGSAEPFWDASINSYTSGKEQGIEKALDYVSHALGDELHALEVATSEKYGLHPEEAAAILSAFMNGESVSEEELQIAIDSICGYYYDSFDLPEEVIDMSSYID